MNKSSGKKEAVVTLQVRADSSLSCNSGDEVREKCTCQGDFLTNWTWVVKEERDPTFLVLVIEWVKVFCTEVDQKSLNLVLIK